jgi:hypothetical protein
VGMPNIPTVSPVDLGSDPLEGGGVVFNFLFATFLLSGQSPTNDHEFN